MRERTMNKCKICGNEFDGNELISGHGIPHQIENMILSDYPGWTDYDLICKNDFEKYRIRHVKSLIEEEESDLRTLESDVIRSISDNEMISSNVNTDYKEIVTVGNRISDKVATFGGSWSFIILFFVTLLAWILVNSSALIFHPFDLYPFILMNLILSCIAAIQAPIIMMSQNRQEKKDRFRAENDYKINLKSEIEIRTLHEKVDHLLLVQWSKLMEIQNLQLEVLEDIRAKVRK